MNELILKGHKVARGRAEGEALVTNMAISFFGGVDPQTGKITDKAHELYNTSVAGKILVFPEEKGSSGGAYQLYEMLRNDVAPKGLVNRRAGPIVVVGAIISNIPMVDKLEPDPFKTIETGDYVAIDADNGTVMVKKKSAAG